MTLTLEDLVKATQSLQESLRDGRKDADLGGLYKNIIRILTTTWRMQSQDFMKEFRDMRSDFTEAPSRTKVDRAWLRAAERANKKLVADIRSEIEEGIRRGAASALTDLKLGPQFGVSFDKNSPQVKQWVDKRVQFVTDSITDTSSKRIQQITQRAANEGWSHAQTGKAIRGEIKSWYTPGDVENRAQLTAFTEMGVGYEQGRTFIANDFKRAGAFIEKRWILVADNRTCPVCEMAVVDDWVPQEMLFANGLASPLAHAGCRCDMELRIADGVEETVMLDAREFETLDDAFKYRWRGQPQSINRYKNKQTRNALVYYGDEGAFQVNRFLRSGQPLSNFRISEEALEFWADDFDNISDLRGLQGRNIFDAIDNGFNAGAPTRENLVLWRGIDNDTGPVDLRNAFGRNPNGWVGKTFTDKAYGSSSLAREEAENFAGSGYLFKILTPKGTRLVTGVDWEAEYIIKRGQKYRIKSVESFKEVDWSFKKKNYIITLEMV